MKISDFQSWFYWSLFLGVKLRISSTVLVIGLVPNNRWQTIISTNDGLISDPYIHGPFTRYIKWWVAPAPGMFSRHRLQRKPLVSDPGIHHGTCVTHVPWCMSGSLTCGGGENVPGIPGACATHNFAYLARGLCRPLWVDVVNSSAMVWLNRI